MGVRLAWPGRKSQEQILAAAARIARTEPPIEVRSDKGCVIAGDNFRAMARLLPRWGGKVDLAYIDPPYNTGRAFVLDGARPATVSGSPGAAAAYGDDLPMEEYLELLMERLVLVRGLLSARGTLYLHIDTKMGHYVKILLDEVFGAENFLNDVARRKSNPKNFRRRAFGNERDSVLVYSRTPGGNIFNDVRTPFPSAELARRFPRTAPDGRRYATVPCHAPGATLDGPTGGPWRGVPPPRGRHWRRAPAELDRLDAAGLVEWSASGVPRIRMYADESRGGKIQDIWLEYKDPQYPRYPTQKSMAMLDMVVRQSSLEGSVAMDCFCGSGAFLEAGLARSRFVLGIDSSPAAISAMRAAPALAGLDFIDISKG